MTQPVDVSAVTAIPNVTLALAARAENVLIVRQALVGVGVSAGLDAIETNDVITAATEAANNVVMHAYDGLEGSMEVDVHVLPGRVLVVVRDRGRGLDGPAQVPAGIGLTVIGALATRVELADVAGGGTEVRMEFPAANGVAAQINEPFPASTELERPNAMRPTLRGARAGDTIEMALAPTALARAVVPRVLAALAARAHFSTDRISDVQLVADAIVAHAHDSLDGTHLGVGIEERPRSLELQIGPLLAGRGSGLIVDSAAAAGIAPIIERLTDFQRVAVDGPRETLALRLVER